MTQAFPACYKAEYRVCLSFINNVERGLLVNKSELIDQIAKEAGLSKAAAGRSLDAATAAIAKALKKGDPVSIVFDLVVDDRKSHFHISALPSKAGLFG